VKFFPHRHWKSGQKRNQNNQKSLFFPSESAYFLLFHNFNEEKEPNRGFPLGENHSTSRWKHFPPSVGKIKKDRTLSVVFIHCACG
jgi:hypothetical protein